MTVKKSQDLPKKTQGNIQNTDFKSNQCVKEALALDSERNRKAESHRTRNVHPMRFNTQSSVFSHVQCLAMTEKNGSPTKKEPLPVFIPTQPKPQQEVTTD